MDPTKPATDRDEAERRSGPASIDQDLDATPPPALLPEDAPGMDDDVRAGETGEWGGTASADAGVGEGPAEDEAFADEATDAAGNGSSPG